ncbi:probable protein S-acyltransferase 22 [Zingiber officinale]|uniref:probable protein S-acyltransferase 22 n=1 Tax=Zingiber officinale TaxID=94328 RepID=UPI001C4AD11D|nr:probable protein S-acyltransferase 22 [Zingiber officinale]
MRKHGWQLPYHPLQVVAIAVFLALGFAFYVFFVPFVGKKLFQYVVMGLYTPLVVSVFFLYIWCAATDPADPGIFRPKKSLKVGDYREQTFSKESKPEDSTKELNAEITAAKQLDGSVNSARHELHSELESGRLPGCITTFLAILLSWCGLSFLCNLCQSHEQSSEQQLSDEGMFYCSLCEVEVLKYSKHCRVCDKCVDGFDHHCRWINNCIGRKNYKRFFILMVFALLLLILQWAVGMLVLILCFVERRRFSAEIVSKLGSSFSLAPFIIVVAVCTLLAMVATLPVAQLFFFHILLIKKGISTYDYIIALREQDQEQEQLAVGGQQSPQMSQVSSFTGLSSTSSFNQFHRGAWCTPPRLFLEDQFDVVPPEIGSSANHKNKKMAEEPVKRRNPGTVKINPWTLARLNAEEVSKAAAQARKRSKILQPVRRETLQEQETESSVDSASGRMALRSDNRKRINKRGRVPVDLPLEPLAKISASATDSNASDLAPETSTSLAPLQLEARNAFRPSMPMSLTRAVSSSPESSLDSPDLHPFRISSSGTEEVQGMNSFSALGNVPPKGIHLSRSTSDGYEASGGEDSDRIPSRIVHRSSNWASIVLGSEHSQITDDLKSYTRQQ